MTQFFATIIGALVTLLAVLLTLRWNQKAHEENLKEEREKRKEEREFSAKQAALLSAAEAVTRFVDYYSTLADRVLPRDGIVAQEITEMNIALNRLHFYCSLKTIEKSMKLGQILSEAVIETLKAKMPSMFVIEELNGIEFQVSSLEKMNMSIQEEIKALLQSDPQNPLIIAHRQQISKNFSEIIGCHQKRAKLFEQKYIATEKCRDVISKNLRAIFEGSRDVLLLAREELSFSINKAKYNKLFDERIESVDKNLKAFHAEMRKQVEEKVGYKVT